MPSVSARDLCALLERSGFALKRQTGSHCVYFNSKKKRLTVVPMHSGDMKPGTVRAILKQAGLSRKDL
jgi:predicted RNA binding protein YcfA (HicA-like mRNA interferase family)